MFESYNVMMVSSLILPSSVTVPVELVWDTPTTQWKLATE